MRTLDAPTQAAIRDRKGEVHREFVHFVVKNLTTGAPVEFGFTNYGEDVSVTVVDGETLAPVVRTYYGDNSPILRIDPVPYRIGLQVDTTTLDLSPIHPIVEQMVRGHNCRGATVQIHRGYFSLSSMGLVANPLCRRLGLINGLPMLTPAIGGQGSMSIKVVSHTRELTKFNPAKRSDAQQKLRSGDRFRKYVGVAHRVEFHWGEVDGTA